MGFFRDLVQRLLGYAEPEPTAPGPAPVPHAEPEPASPSPRPAPAEPLSFPAPTMAADPPLKSKVEPVRSSRWVSEDFLPISRDELKAKARGTGRGMLLFNLFFGRRDQIPPATDERTRLIDRALVTHGYLSSQALAEIHRVGDAMDQAQPTELIIDHRATLAGEAAVQADRLERARIKARKKAEAADRKRRRAEEIAHRHQTEIVFLGRGVSKFLGDYTSDLAALEQAGLPALSTPGDLAEALGLSVSRLRWLAFHAEAATVVHYVSFTVPKKSGGTRTLSAPHRSMASAQRWILDRIVGHLPAEPEAHGFLPGRSILTNARPHAGQSVVVNMDLENFFPSISYRRVRSVFRRVGYSPSVATVLALLCTECPRRPVVYDGKTYHVATAPRGLPQGASTSPGLSNQVSRRLDRRLAGLAGKLAANYTRYADDLTFSGDKTLDARVGYLMARVRHLAEAEGFAVNQAKTRVLRSNNAQVVTGLVVNDRPGVPRNEVRRLRAILHRARVEGLDAQNRDGHPNFRAWLQGKIAYVRMARPEVGGQLLAEFLALSTKDEET